MMGRLLCSIGLHRWHVPDWDAWRGKLWCDRCKKCKPMTGRVLAEWIRYRTRREGNVRKIGG